MGCGNGVAGYKGKPFVSKDGGLTYLVVTKAKDMSINKNMSPIDVTSFDTIEGWKDFISGLKDWDGSIEKIYLEADPGQEAILAGIDAGDKLIFQYRPNNVTGAKYIEGEILIKTWALKNALADAVMVSSSFQGCGKPQTKILP